MIFNSEKENVLNQTAKGIVDGYGAKKHANCGLFLESIKLDWIVS